MKRKIASAVFILAVAAFTVGCSSYYKITDPGSDNVYYAKGLERNDSGSIVFTDGSSGNTITLQNSEVQKIKKKEYKANIAPK